MISGVLRRRSFLRHIWPGAASTRRLQGKSTTVTRGESLDIGRRFSFVETGVLEPRPRLLVDRLLFARAAAGEPGARAALRAR